MIIQREKKNNENEYEACTMNLPFHFYYSSFHQKCRQHQQWLFISLSLLLFFLFSRVRAVKSLIAPLINDKMRWEWIIIISKWFSLSNLLFHRIHFILSLIKRFFSRGDNLVILLIINFSVKEVKIMTRRYISLFILLLPLLTPMLMLLLSFPHIHT